MRESSPGHPDNTTPLSLSLGSPAIFESVVSGLADSVLVADRDGRVLFLNRAAERLLGAPARDALLSEWPERYGLYLADRRTLFPADRLPLVRAVRGENAEAVELFVRNPAVPEGVWAAVSATPLKDDAGEPSGCVVLFSDITKHKRTEEALRKERDWASRTADELRQANGTLRAVIETSPLAIVTMDLEAIVKTWNRAAEEIFGWLAHEVIGQPFPIVPDEDQEFFRKNLERLMRGETIVGVERQRKRKDGTVIDVSLWNAPLRDGSGNVTGGISVIADMTDRKRLEDQVWQSQKMEAVGRLAGGVAHDFNNLLTVITGYTQMLLAGLEEEHPMRGYVEEIVRASDSAAALTNQLLAFSRRQMVSPQVLDLNTLVSGMDRLLHRVIGEDIDVTTSLAPGLPRVKVDEGQFEQVIMNLAVNARDAMPTGGRLIIKTDSAVIADVNPEGIAPGNYVSLSVSDTGKGMTEEVRRRVFEPFFTTDGKGRGTGLGLSTVFGIVKQAGGEVVVESEPGSGSTFRIYLPAVGRAAAAGVKGAALHERKAGTETILVVEDQGELRKLVREVLRSQGYTVLESADFREALRIAETYSGPIHLCLTDMVLPGMNGRELASRVRHLRPTAKVLYMSGHTNHAALELEPETVPTPFLQKPFAPEVLLMKIRDVLDQ